MKDKKLFVLLGLVLALCLTALPTGTAFAFADIVGCGDYGGTWTNTGVNTGECAFPAGHEWAVDHCGNTVESIVDYWVIGDEGPFIDHFVCFGPAAFQPLVHSELCKLLDIDREIGIGHPFSASWLGKLESLRFRQVDSGVFFVSPSSMGWADKAHVGSFTAYLSEGTYWVSCVGTEGGIGADELKVMVSH